MINVLVHATLVHHQAILVSKKKNEKGKTQTYSWPIVAIGFRCAMDIDDAKRMGLGQDLPQIME